MRVVAILQARMGSTRLPGKVMLPLAGKPMVRNIVDRVKRSTRLDAVVLTVPDQDYFNFEGLGITIDCWMDDPSDLVGRYLKAATESKADLIVRIPCDNPCVDAYYIDKAIERYLLGHHIFLTNTTLYVDQKYYDGVGAEVFSLSRLKWLDEHTKGQPQYREHPHLWFYDHLRDVIDHTKQQFHQYPIVRLDVNTQADYEFIKNIYDHFGHNRFTTDEVIGYLHGVPA